MSTFRQIAPQPVGQADIYIPRVLRTRATFAFVSSVFVERGIGFVEHVDFVEISATRQSKDSTKAEPFVKHPDIVSAFVKVVFWYKPMLDDIQGVEQMFKLFLFQGLDEHWLLLPNKKPVERTILNIHQVASYTTEALTKIADMTSIMEEILKQNRELAKQVADMRQELDANKTKETIHQTETVITIAHRSPDTDRARRIASEKLCGNS
jgi:hypothetical protein